jgi:hypothetical protein
VVALEAGAGASIRQFDLFGPSLREKREQAAPKPAETRKATAAASQTTNSESMHPRPPPATGAGNRRTFGRSAPPSWPTVCGGSSAQPSRAPAAHGRPGYVVDHIIPLKRGGADEPWNMQWQTIAEGKAKDATE